MRKIGFIDRKVIKLSEYPSSETINILFTIQRLEWENDEMIMADTYFKCYNNTGDETKCIHTLH